MTTLLDRMTAHPQVRVKDIGDGIVACNFTRKAFAKGLWDNETCLARGLFINSNTGDIVARGYQKFFGVGDYNGPSVEKYISTVSYPVTVAEKGNGYLGIMSTVNGELRMFSKSGITSYSEHAMNLFQEATSKEQKQDLLDYLELMDASVLFEIIDPWVDPHIVEYSNPELMIIGLVANTEEFQLLPTGVVEHILGIGESSLFRVPIKTVVESEEELVSAIKSSQSSMDTEGTVLCDDNGYMVKVKSERYLTVKSYRGVLEKVLRGEEVSDLRATSVLEELKKDGYDGLSNFAVKNINGDQVLDLPVLAHYIP